MRKPTTELMSAGPGLAPAAFGTFGDDLLVGTFRDRRISAFRPASGGVPGRLQDPGGHPVTINGLWRALPKQTGAK